MIDQKPASELDSTATTPAVRMTETMTMTTTVNTLVLVPDYGDRWRDDLAVACDPIAAALGVLRYRLGVPMPAEGREAAVADMLPLGPAEAVAWVLQMAAEFDQAAARVRRIMARIERDARGRAARLAAGGAS